MSGMSAATEKLTSPTAAIKQPPSSERYPTAARENFSCMANTSDFDSITLTGFSPIDDIIS